MTTQDKKRKAYMIAIAEEELRKGDVVTITMNQDGTDVRARKSLPRDYEKVYKSNT